MMTEHFEAGFEVRALPDGRTLLSFSDGSHYSLTIRVEDFFRLVDAWFGGVEEPHLPPTWREDSRALRDLLAAHRSDAPGLREKEAPSSASAPCAEGHPVLVVGEKSLASLLVSALNESGGIGLAASRFFGDYRETARRAAELGATVLLCHSSADDAGFGCFARLATTARIDWAPLTFERSDLWVGPLLRPGRGAQFQDLRERRIAAADNEVVVGALREQPLNGTRVPALLAERVPQIVEALHRIRRTPDLLGQVRLESGEIVEHTVLPIPREPEVLHHPHAIDDLVSHECGIVTGIRRIEHNVRLPRGLVSVQVDVASCSRVSQWDDVISCQGSTWGDEEGARLAALGETAERYAANRHDTRPLVVSTHRRLAAAGLRPLEPDSLVLYSGAQYATPGFPASPFLPDTELEWVEGWSETRGEAVWVPASLVYTNWRKGRRIHEPIIHMSPFAGVAAGPSKEFALVSAIEELVERHATMLWWLNGFVFDGLVLPREVRALWEECPDQEASVIPLPNEFDIPVAAGVVRDHRDGLLNVGFAARGNILDAGLKAWSEAITLQEGSRDLLDPASLHLKAIREGVVPAGAMKPYREDRLYGDDFRPDFSDCTDLMAQQQVYLDPRNQERVCRLVAPQRTVDPAALPSLRERSFGEYRSRIEGRGFEIISVDITPPDIASLGLYVYRVVIPGLIGNAAAAYPLLGGGRVFDIPVELGWAERPLAPSEMNRMPLPHA